MSIEELYADFLHHHADGAHASAAIDAAEIAKIEECVTDGMEEELHTGFVADFIAGIVFMKEVFK